MIPKSLIFCLISLFIFINKAASQKSDAEVIKYITFCEVETDKLIQTDSITIQINTRAGDDFTEIEIPFSKTQKVSDIDAWLENVDGIKFRKLKKSDIIDKSSISDISLYEDDFKKCFQLRHNIYPYRIVYTFKTTYRNYITIAHWTPIISKTIPTRNAKLQITLPKNYLFKKYLNNVSEARIDSTGNIIILEWRTSYDKQLKSEIFSQPDDFLPYVIVSPLYFQYGVNGCSKDWESFGNWQFRLMQDLDNLPDDEKNTITSLIRGMTDKKEIIKTLYHYLQDHTRYINVSIGIGGLKPYPASYVAQNKYGDCKALTNFMKALLNFAGIESFYTLIQGSEQPKDLIKGFAGPQFNHVVLAVPINNDTIWLENTNNTNPFGYMGTFTQNREALMVSKDHSRIVRTPSLKNANDLVSYHLTFDLNLSGKAIVKVKTTYRGRDFERFNALHSDFNDDEKDRIIREYMPFDNYEVINWGLKKINRDTARIELFATISLNKLIKPLGNEYYFSLYPVRIPDFTIPAKRTLPVILPYPLCNSDTLVYNLPAGYKLKATPDIISLITKYGSYELELMAKNTQVIVIKRFELFSGKYSLEQFPDFYSFIKSARDNDKMNIVIEPIN